MLIAKEGDAVDGAIDGDSDGLIVGDADDEEMLFCDGLLLECCDGSASEGLACTRLLFSFYMKIIFRHLNRNTI